MALADRLRDYWFGPGSAVRLGLFRVAICALALRLGMEQYGVAMLSTLGGDGLILEFEWQPIFLFEVFGIPRPSAGFLRFAHVLHVGFLLGGILGVRSRLSCGMAAILHFYTTGVRYGYGQAHHGDIGLMFALAILAFVPCGARMSWDSIRRRLRDSRRSVPSVEPDQIPLGSYAIRFAQWTIAIGYCAAAISKFVIAGPEWFNGYSLQKILLSGNNPLGNLMAESRSLAAVLAIVTVLAQLTFPLCIPFPKFRWFSVPAVCGFHLATEFTGVTGTYISLWAVVLVTFVPLDRLIPGLKSLAARSSHPARRWALAAGSLLATSFLVWRFADAFFDFWVWLTAIPASLMVLFAIWPSPRTVVFDGACALCRRTVAMIRILDWGNEVQFVDLRKSASIGELHPDLDEASCRASMHVLYDGRVTQGYEAFRQIVARLPLLAPAAIVMRAAPLRALGQRWYPRIARARRIDGCDAGECPLRDPGA